MPSAFEPCIPTRGTKVPDRPEWFHEIKHDGYRMIVIRTNDRVHLVSRSGLDWSKRFPRIVEAARQIRRQHDPIATIGPAATWIKTKNPHHPAFDRVMDQF